MSRSLAGYVTQRPHFQLLEVLAGIAAWQDSRYQGRGARWAVAGKWCITRQSVILEWWARMAKRYDFPGAMHTMSRRTLNYQIAGLKAAGYIHPDTRRHIGQRGTNKLRLRPSIYKFTLAGQQWIKRRQGWVSNLSAQLAVQTVAHSSFKPVVVSRKSCTRAVDKSPTAQGNERAAAARRPTPEVHSTAKPRPGKALSRGGRERARIAQARRNALGIGQGMPLPPKRRQRR